MFTILRADKVEGGDLDIRREMAEIFANGFTQWLGYFSKNEQVIAKAFAHMFVLDQFYVAIVDNKVAAMVACTDCKTGAVKLDGQELRKHFGLIKGSIARLVLKKEFESPFKNPPSNTGSIEFVGTSLMFRGQGAASQVMSYILDNLPYKVFLIEEVADTNIAAMNLYKKMGFKEYKRIPVPLNRAKKIGINNLIALMYEKN